VFLLDQVTDDFVVKILNMFPFNALPAILLLLRLQCQLNEELLKLFIAEVDAELFKTVSLKYFKAIDVQDSYNLFFLTLLGL